MLRLTRIKKFSGDGFQLCAAPGENNDCNRCGVGR